MSQRVPHGDRDVRRGRRHGPGSGGLPAGRRVLQGPPGAEVTAANWTTCTGDDEDERYALVLSVVLHWRVAGAFCQAHAS